MRAIRSVCPKSHSESSIFLTITYKEAPNARYAASGGNLSENDDNYRIERLKNITA